MRPETSPTNQQSRFLQPSMVLYLMPKLLRAPTQKEFDDKPSPLNVLLVLTTLGIA
ncbi:unnamed protein product [Hymenolepis diminuta]|uniref:Uncharacterized protein n=1 Tax=Hymenolepis diminuta TaxID=6216 RepID=A0A564ZB07_HYMDI|nr:unnamed protein product [Hymenolepis diminuta]